MKGSVNSAFNAIMTFLQRIPSVATDGDTLLSFARKVNIDTDTFAEYPYLGILQVRTKTYQFPVTNNKL